jgi:peptidoglycan/xylan/chitin deacetylase (PgdA/CDA1 family)
LAADFEVLVFKILAVLAALSIAPAAAAKLDSPTLRLPYYSHGQRVALTFDACSGKVDMRILDALVQHKIKSTLFVTGRWLRRNPDAIAIMAAHADLFEIENHGARHLVAIATPTKVFGVKAAGNAAALAEEVKGGAEAIAAAFGQQPTWFRGATATYTKSSENDIEAMGYHIAGFSRLGDGGAAFSTARTAKAFASAEDGDVIIAHINQPLRPAGEGVVEGIAALKAKGFVFVTLNDAFRPVTLRHIGH